MGKPISLELRSCPVWTWGDDQGDGGTTMDAVEGDLPGANGDVL
jgi:hypothetical protein